MGDKPISVSKHQKGQITWIMLRGDDLCNHLSRANEIYGLEIIDDFTWLIPYTRVTWNRFLSMKVPYRIVFTSEGKHPTSTSASAQLNGDNTGIVSNKDMQTRASDNARQETSNIFLSTDEKISVRYHAPNFYISMPYQSKLVTFVKDLDRSYWNAKYKNWIVRGSVTTMNRLQERFGFWTSDQIEQLTELLNEYHIPKRVMLYPIPETASQVALKVEGINLDHSIVKQLPDRSYQKEYKRWIIPNEQAIIDRIVEHFEAQGVQVELRLPSAIKCGALKSSLKDRQERLCLKFADCKRPLVKRLSDRLIQLRYSWRTVTAYVGPVVRFDTWLQVPIDDATTDHVNQFLSELSAQRVSESLIHRHVNAIKFYYEKVTLNPSISIRQIKRPKQSRSLPRIMSRKEVYRMIMETTNIKHRTILFTLYSSGLRLGELLALQLKDIYWDRNQMLIRGGKGKKDRMVMLSEVLKESLRQYCDTYMPQLYLFESTDAGKSYGERSVQNIVKKAAQRAKIGRRVTPHTLRHCFATHLHDGGISIKFIQELLGHKDVKTTMIYTHVSTEMMVSIQSPLDSMMKGSLEKTDLSRISTTRKAK